MLEENNSKRVEISQFFSESVSLDIIIRSLPTLLWQVGRLVAFWGHFFLTSLGECAVRRHSSTDGFSFDYAFFSCRARPNDFIWPMAIAISFEYLQVLGSQSMPKHFAWQECLCVIQPCREFFRSSLGCFRFQWAMCKFELLLDFPYNLAGQDRQHHVGFASMGRQLIQCWRFWLARILGVFLLIFNRRIRHWHVVPSHLHFGAGCALSSLLVKSSDIWSTSLR